MGSQRVWLLEGLWWLVTAGLVILVIWPIRDEIFQFPFERSNIFFIVCFITSLRWFLLLKTTPFAKNIWVKLVLLFAAIWTFLYSLQLFSKFQVFIDEKGIESITFHLTEARQIALSKYIVSEYIFFAVGSMIICFMIPIRMVISIWRTYNLNKA
jgi:hypothetical protein